MLRERRHRWPHRPNPHVVVSQITATDPGGPPASTAFFHGLYAAGPTRRTTVPTPST
ncbi:hypothetical protein [Kitasatospora sp. NPDC085879]|uniref:hypothetical protein n=1 Tax=Kitasatospora sp. NPDC085879 TaxID=3154769 RepID=UPI00341B95D2